LAGNEVGGKKDKAGMQALAAALKMHSMITELNLSNNGLSAKDMPILAPAIEANGALSKLTWSGDQCYDGGYEDAPPVTLDTTMTEADFSNKHLGVSGAIIILAVLRSKFFWDSRSLSKLTFCGIDRWGFEGDAVTIDTSMTEADFSGKKLGAVGAQILAAFMSTKLFEAKGSLASLDISNDSIGLEQEAIITQICTEKSITLTLRSSDY
jgi:hypothetical protein